MGINIKITLQITAALHCGGCVGGSVWLQRAQEAQQIQPAGADSVFMMEHGTEAQAAADFSLLSSVHTYMCVWVWFLVSCSLLIW